MAGCMDVVGYVTGDGELVCPDCAAKVRHRGSMCGQFARLSPNGWHRCDVRPALGQSPCVTVPVEGPEMGVVFGGSESDCPNHCPYCDERIEESYTGEGVRYILDALDAHRNGGDCVDAAHRPGVRALLEEWAGALDWYNLDRADELRLKRWSRWCARNPVAS